MKQFAVIGNPIGHSLSPDLHNYVYRSLDIDANYEKKKVFKNELPQVMDDLRTGVLNGVNVTIPHKENVLDYLDEINPRAKIIGSVNVIHKNGDKLFGNNTDWFGFSKSLKKNGIEVKNKEVIVLGAGGTSKSILFALKQTGVKKIVLLNRTLQKAKELQDDIVFPYSLDDSVQLIKNDSIIINTTPIGMQSEQCPIDLGLLHKNQTLIDIIYTPMDTVMLKFGNKIGAITLNGLDMFIYQALVSMDLWFGEDISKQVDINKLKKYLTDKLE